jgi:hypothetical protein
MAQGTVQTGFHGRRYHSTEDTNGKWYWKPVSSDSGTPSQLAPFGKRRVNSVHLAQQPVDRTTNLARGGHRGTNAENDKRLYSDILTKIALVDRTEAVILPYTQSTPMIQKMIDMGLARRREIFEVTDRMKILYATTHGLLVMYEEFGLIPKEVKNFLQWDEKNGESPSSYVYLFLSTNGFWSPGPGTRKLTALGKRLAVTIRADRADKEEVFDQALRKAENPNRSTVDELEKFFETVDRLAKKQYEYLFDPKLAW